MLRFAQMTASCAKLP